jgi:hypothetical protein
VTDHANQEWMQMLKRRSAMIGGLAMATASSLTRVAMADADRPTLVFVGHEL